MNLKEKALAVHQKYKGKLSVEVKTPVEGEEDLSLIYSPGVAEPCKAIAENEDNMYNYTIKGNSVAVVTNGSAVLGLGNIGAGAAMPVMEGKGALFKLFGGIDAVPLCLNTDDTQEIVNTVKLLEPTFGGINLEDIAAPHCFVIEEQLKKELNIPVFHDDQHGTAIVTAAGLINALKLAEKKLADIKVVINGAGAAGVAVVNLLLSMGVEDIILCDSKGPIYEGRPNGMNNIKEDLAAQTNRKKEDGSLEDAVKGADVFIGVSVAGALTSQMVQSMNDKAIIFAMANPDPEITPEAAKEAGALVIGTGRSDFANQINNVLAFPGIFRGALDVKARAINEEMKIAAVYAIANLISEEELHSDYVIPSPFNEEVVSRVAEEVARAAIESGVAKAVGQEEVVKV
ncbi:NAD(P)-dependent malic enzyme [Alteribacillus iranensis]|uniref:Malate dehydrogenase (Oxaloacetate-decarboxylating) n=1 Tax=Alteribacillus iranensis TaxID=930128 RepID=A0A1I2DMF1_9BACI|nr:malic enzyme-like NAD(P)-binding protein [Alteribacillus iranensis]SFE81666.1 malate dehydrogenase (oxaloacetate-decarboxylating) [Alteribacillus iranensis]